MGGKGSGKWHEAPVIDFAPDVKRGKGRPQRNKDDGVVRKRGRPIRGEEKDRALIIHQLDKMSEERRLTSAKQTIAQAERIYKKYNSPFPNPLNIDDKLLAEEARETWKYIYSCREYTEVPRLLAYEHSLYNGTEVCIAFEGFSNYIRNNNFVKKFERPDGEIGVLPIIPNLSNLASWLGMSRGAISKCMKDDSTETDMDNYRSMLADLLSEGAMMGIYNTSMAIFSLKNLCDWADKYEDRPNKKSDTAQTVEEAQALMASLGYTKLIGESNGNKEET